MPVVVNEESEVKKKKHFMKLHERIHIKYQEMQRKLEKSKSVDSLSTYSDSLSYKEIQYASNYDLREIDEVYKSESDLVYKEREEFMEQHSNPGSKIIVRTESLEADISRTNSVNFDDEWEKLDNSFEESNLSLESLPDVGIDESSHAPPSRSLRQRIESKILEVKLRRQQRRVEKQRRIKLKSIEAPDIAERIVLSNSAKEVARVTKKNKIATVTIALIEATGLENTTDERIRLLFCRFRLGTEKCKSKILRSNGAALKWQELFNLTMFEEQSVLEVNLYDRDNMIGRASVDLTDLTKEKTHKLKLPLLGDISGIQLLLLITISGICLLNTVTEADDVVNANQQLDRMKPAWYSLENNMTGVGWLSVIVYGAKGLIAQDCYCVLKLANERVQTHTEYKTNDPSWMKIFTFNLPDITTILEVLVIDEKKGEEIGRISVPLLRINNGAKVWYALKDQSQRERAKGQNARILLEMSTSWRLSKAAIQVINPKEVDLLATNAKFDRRLFTRNLARAKAVTNWTLNSLKIIKTCFEWESRKSNTIALIAWTLFCYFFKIWMLPLLLLIPFVRYRPRKYYLIKRQSSFGKQNGEADIVKIEKEEKSTLRQKLNTLQEMIQTVQNGIGRVASLGESVKNLYNFTVPFVSLLAIFLILVISFIMYLVPLKYILILWGIHKYTRKILRPNRIPNSEILDLLSRVPDDETLLNCEQLPLEISSDDDSVL